MEDGPSWDANPFSASQEIPRILWNLKVLTAFTNVWKFHKKRSFYGEELLAPRTTPKLEDHPSRLSVTLIQ